MANTDSTHTDAKVIAFPSLIAPVITLEQILKQESLESVWGKVRVLGLAVLTRSEAELRKGFTGRRGRADSAGFIKNIDDYISHREGEIHLLRSASKRLEYILESARERA